MTSPRPISVVPWRSRMDGLPLSTPLLAAADGIPRCTSGNGTAPLRWSGQGASRWTPLHRQLRRLVILHALSWSEAARSARLLLRKCMSEAHCQSGGGSQSEIHQPCHLESTKRRGWGRSKKAYLTLSYLPSESATLHQDQQLFRETTDRATDPSCFLMHSQMFSN